MTYDYVTIERTEPVATVTFDRKKNLNAFDSKLILELTDVARHFQEDLDVRALVLTGSRNYFSAGADLEDLGTHNALGDVARRESFYRGERLCEA